MTQEPCGCGRLHYKLVFSCSGAADVGALADQAARRLSQEKVASMNCIAAVAARAPEYLDTARHAAGILAIDGCPKSCTKQILDDAGFHGFIHLQLGSLGFEKGKAPPTESACRQVVRHARSMIEDEPESTRG